MSRPHFAFLDHEGPIAFAHRGGDAAGAEKENTMAAFQAAYDLGYRYFETDVILSADDQVMATHGSKNEKAVEATGLPLRSKLQAMTAAEMRAEVQIGGEPIPQLAEVLQAFPDVRVNIDPKTKEVVKPLGRLLTELSAVDRVCIGAFSYARTKGVAEEVGGQDKICTALGPLGFIALKAPNLLPGYLAHAKAACLQLPLRKKDLQQQSNNPDLPNDPIITESSLGRAHEAGLAVHVWTVNDGVSINRALNMGVDGIMSDELRRLKEFMWLDQTFINPQNSQEG